MLKQVTKDEDVVRLATVEELNFNFLKSSYAKVIDKEIENEQIFRKLVMDLMPEFDRLVTSYEFRWRKNRHQFTLLEREKVMKEFEKKHIDKLQGRRI